jgi:hypothetical protein
MRALGQKGPKRTPGAQMGTHNSLGDTGEGPHEDPKGRGVMGVALFSANVSLPLAALGFRHRF